ADLLREEPAAAQSQHTWKGPRDRFQPICQVSGHALMQKRRVPEGRACAALALAHKPWLEWTQLGIAHGFILSRGRGVPETRRDLAAVGRHLAAAFAALRDNRRPPRRDRGRALGRAQVFERPAVRLLWLPAAGRRIARRHLWRVCRAKTGLRHGAGGAG